MEIKAKKSLGQNFLIDKTVLEDIVSAIDPKKGEAIVEIGPGQGELTLPLLASGANVIAIEKDNDLVKQLAKSKVKGQKLKVIEGDALDIIRNSLVGQAKLEIQNSDKWKLVGNIPYYITGHLFRIIGELKNKPSSIVFMIQKEVAERICAEKGEMNLLAASIQIWAKPEIVRFVSRNAFKPAPKVDSAVIKLIPIRNSLAGQAKFPGRAGKIQNYYKLLHIVFKQPRKTLFNNLRDGGIPEDKIKKEFNLLNIDIKSRPQDLDIEDLKKLSAVLK